MGSVLIGHVIHQSVLGHQIKKCPSLKTKTFNKEDREYDDGRSMSLCAIMVADVDAVVVVVVAVTNVVAVVFVVRPKFSSLLMFDAE